MRSNPVEDWESERNIIAGERAKWRDLARRLARIVATTMWRDCVQDAIERNAVTEEELGAALKDEP